MRSKTQRQRIYMHICEAHNTHVICKVHMLNLCRAFCHPPPPCFAVIHPPMVCIYPPVVCIIHPPVRINIISRRHNMAMHARCLQWQLNEILKIRILYSVCTLPKSFVYSLMSLKWKWLTYLLYFVLHSRTIIQLAVQRRFEASKLIATLGVPTWDIPLRSGMWE